jgi:putative transposase
MFLWRGTGSTSRYREGPLLIAIMDDASRLITCYSIFDSTTMENVITVLEKGFRKYGISNEILTDHGT